ncbi:hypothetical protein WN55_10598 [Dufourea novaeangliae]|uniref:Uncharacterized protein n=1 Tax=Dufourea novaeangliae TaxID=178035 RepID=A0A154P442_DUFNO|nr:hypothetical protein WN55_10598 [Dufourea novaeangliae]
MKRFRPRFSGWDNKVSRDGLVSQNKPLYVAHRTGNCHIWLRGYGLTHFAMFKTLKVIIENYPV